MKPGTSDASEADRDKAGYLFTDQPPTRAEGDPYSNVRAPGDLWMLEEQVAPHWWAIRSPRDDAQSFLAKSGYVVALLERPGNNRSDNELSGTVENLTRGSMRGCSIFSVERCLALDHERRIGAGPCWPEIAQRLPSLAVVTAYVFSPFVLLFRAFASGAPAY